MTRCRVSEDITQHDRDCEKAGIARQDAIQDELSVVWTEIAEGQHDAEIANSAWIDQSIMAKVAREAIHRLPNQLRDSDIYARSDFGLQIDDYALDTAERRVDSTGENR